MGAETSQSSDLVSSRLTQGQESRKPALIAANINPTFSWVRLAQRIPVRIQLDAVDTDVRLIAGRTATIVDLSFQAPPLLQRERVH